MGSDNSELINLNSSSKDEDLSVNDQDINENLESFPDGVVDESSKPLSISFENLSNDDLVHDFRTLLFS